MRRDDISAGNDVLRAPKGLPEQVRWKASVSPETSAAELAEQVAIQLREVLNRQGYAKLAVSGGSTPIRFFQILSQQEITWERVEIILVDERWVSADSSNSNEQLVRKHLLQRNAKNAKFSPLYQGENGLAQTLDRRREELFELARDIDVLVLGMGEDGHTASLFPGMPGLKEALESSRPGYIEALPESSLWPRVSLNKRAITQAKMCFMQLVGGAKKQVLEEVCRTQEEMQHPAWSILSTRDVSVYWAPNEEEAESGSMETEV